jgi:hypothetical protein
MMRQIFLAHVCITSDTERDQNRKSNFQKSKIQKLQKQKNREIEKVKSENFKFGNRERICPQICRLRSYRLGSDEAPSTHSCVAITLRSPSQCLYSLYISSPLAVLLNEEIDLHKS